jgi:hypothetical protein
MMWAKGKKEGIKWREKEEGEKAEEKNERKRAIPTSIGEYKRSKSFFHWKLCLEYLDKASSKTKMASRR